jgi:hypothetical protein
LLQPAQQVTGFSPPDTKLLRANVLVGWGYMVLGVFAGLALHFTIDKDFAWFGIVLFLVLLMVGLVLAPPWLRQKITWQKANLPFLYRLANVPTQGVDPALANALTAIVQADVPPGPAARQVVIGGPIGSGRTEMAAAIGTEFAFKERKVRYVTFTALLEFAESLPPSGRDRNDSGPDNIGYWPWIDAQVLVIDDVGPLISAQPSAVDRVKEFERLLASDLAPAHDYLRTCHTVWVLGDHLQPRPAADQQNPQNAGGATLEKFAEVIAHHCRGQQGQQLVIELASRAPPGPKGPAPVRVRTMSRV